MLATTFIKRRVQQVMIFSLLSLSSFTVASPSFAVSLTLNNWERLGDVVTPGQATATNALADGSDDTVKYNVSGNHPAYINSLETFLGLNSGDLGLDATEGSAIKTALKVLDGDVISFDYSLLTYDASSTDRAFVTISNSIIPLTGNSTFSHTFAKSGTYNVGIGVVDVNDYIGSSKLSVTNANYQPVSSQPVPEPLTTLGSVIAIGFGVMCKRKQIKNQALLKE